MLGQSIDSRIQAGATLLIPSGPTGHHLFVVVLAGRVTHKTENLLLACFCTIRHPAYDKTCIIKAGEHPFVVSDSFISYAHCRSESAAHVIARLDDGTFKASGNDVSSELLARITSGLAVAGGRTPRHIRADWGLA